MTHSLFPKICRFLHCREEKKSLFMGNHDSASPVQPCSFSFWKPSPMPTAAVLTSLSGPSLSISQKSGTHIFLMSSCRVPSPNLPLGKVVAFLDSHGHYENEFRTTEEPYFQNIGIRVNHTQIGNVPTGHARLKYCATLKWVSCSKGGLTYYTNFPVV